MRRCTFFGPEPCRCRQWVDSVLGSATFGAMALTLLAVTQAAAGYQYMPSGDVWIVGGASISYPPGAIKQTSSARSQPDIWLVADDATRTARSTIPPQQAATEPLDSRELYPGRYVATCTPAPIVGCVCRTEPNGQVMLFRGATVTLESTSPDPEYRRMIEWLQRTCTSLAQQ
jgi:hypothetical protein